MRQEYLRQAPIHKAGARCTTCGAEVPPNEVAHYCADCGSALSKPGARPATLGLWLIAVITAYMLVMAYAASEYTFGSVYEGGTPKSITDAGRLAAQVGMALSFLGMGLSIWGMARHGGSRRGWYAFAALGAFLSFGWAASCEAATF